MRLNSLSNLALPPAPPVNQDLLRDQELAKAQIARAKKAQWLEYVRASRSD